MIQSEIRCDQCGKVGTGSGIGVSGRWRAHIARQNLHNMGWGVGLPGGRDLCDHCIYAPHRPPPWRSEEKAKND